VGLNFKIVSSLLWLVMKITVATGTVKSSEPVATVIRPSWQRLNVATSTVIASAHCYCGLLLHIHRKIYDINNKDS
jgi:hypothetical protein